MIFYLYLYCVMQTGKRIGAFVLAILIWVATSSFTLSMHYCGSQMVSYSTVGKAKACCEIDNFQFTAQQQEAKSTMFCCHNKELEKEPEEQLTFSITKAEVQFQQILLRLPQLINIGVNKETLSLPILSKPTDGFLSSCYYPDKNILFQVFLI